MLCPVIHDKKCTILYCSYINKEIKKLTQSPKINCTVASKD